MTSVAPCLSSSTEEAIATSPDPPVDDQYRSMIRDAIHDGLSSYQWGWLQSIAPALRKNLGSDPRLTPTFVREVIAEAELNALWPYGWADAQLAEFRAVQRLRRPRSRRTYVARGELVGISKLTTRGVQAIRRRYRNRYRKRVTIKMLAKDHDVNPMTIRRVLLRVTWRHVK